MNSQTNRRLGIALAAVGILAVRPAMAVVPTDWDGATIGVEYLFPNTGNLYESDGAVVVGPGPEGTLTEIQFSYDISGNQIVLSGFSSSNWNSSSFNGPHFFDAGGDDLNLTGVSVNPASNMDGLSNANLTWDGDNIFLNWQGLSFNSETQVILDLQFNGEQSVPEASTWAAGGALAAVVGGMWFRRRRA
jgi:hypothetical protein